MDDALVPKLSLYSVMEVLVLILVLMDDALVRLIARYEKAFNFVLILVLMDDALVHIAENTPFTLVCGS